jgi:phosphoribosylformimino-5-aminoimidazole carboxamide ribotide isomerase
MILFPAIDLVSGKVVRLAKGDRWHMDVYSNDPGEVAGRMADTGAAWIHVVDLSATFEEDVAARKANDAAIRDIASNGAVSLDIGGGVRSLERIEELLGLGAKRIALGTVLARDPELARTAVSEFGDVLVADIAAEDGVVRVNGWRDDTELELDGFLGSLSKAGYAHLVFTDIAKDGMRSGIDTAAYERIAGVFGRPVVASGGIASMEDIRALAALGDGVIEGMIVGRALYEGDVDLAEALVVVGEA